MYLYPGCQLFSVIRSLRSRSAHAEVSVAALMQQYQGLIECEDIGNGNYKLSIVDKNISNSEVQKILVEFEKVNVESLDVANCNCMTKLDLKHFAKLRELSVSNFAQA